MRVLLGAALAALVLSSAFAAAVFTGLISVGPPRASVAEPPPPASPPRAAGPAAAPTTPTRPTPPQPKVTRQETFGDWIFICNELPQSAEVRCSMIQTISEANTRAMVFLWRIVQDGEGGLVSIWQTPDAVLLHGGISLDIGTPEPIVIPYETCQRGRCQAVVNLTENFVETLAAAEKAVATLVAPDGRKINLTLSVNGLADGLEALQTDDPPSGGQPAASPPAAQPSAN